MINHENRAREERGAAERRRRARTVGGRRRARAVLRRLGEGELAGFPEGRITGRRPRRYVRNV